MMFSLFFLKGHVLRPVSQIRPINHTVGHKYNVDFPHAPSIIRCLFILFFYIIENETI